MTDDDRAEQPVRCPRCAGMAAHEIDVGADGDPVILHDFTGDDFEPTDDFLLQTEVRISVPRSVVADPEALERAVKAECVSLAEELRPFFVAAFREARSKREAV